MTDIKSFALFCDVWTDNDTGLWWDAIGGRKALLFYVMKIDSL